jgi:hypothetical protein
MNFIEVITLQTNSLQINTLKGLLWKENMSEKSQNYFKKTKQYTSFIVYLFIVALNKNVK